MDLLTVIGLAALKILFVVLVVVGAFAPMLVWAERRQSAMIQDRVGPSRADLPLPKGLVDFMKATLKPMELGIFASFFAAGLSIVALVILLLTGKVSLFGLEPKAYYEAVLGFGILGVLLRVGHKVHSSLSSDGKLQVFGMLHPLADALKLIFKEDFVPPKADKLLHALAPIISFIPTLGIFAVIPFADTLFLECATDVVPRDVATVMACDGSGVATAVPMQVGSIDMGILFIFAIAGTGIIGAALGGYASDNKYSLMGGLRAASQMVSYEVALGLTIVPCFMVYGSLRLEDMAYWQHTHLWGVLVPPLTIAFVLYTFAAIAESKRIPFDLPEGESELVGGYLTEYSGMKFGLFFMGEFVEVVGLAALANALFFGGWDVPFLYRSGLDFWGTWELSIPMTDWVIPDQILLQHWAVLVIEVLFTLVKIIVLIWFQLMIRWTLPRFRYDQLMKLCWKMLLPLALANILFTGIAVLLWS